MASLRKLFPTKQELADLIYDAWVSSHADSDVADQLDSYVEVRVHVFGPDRIAQPNTWSFNTGSGDYDPAHVDLCAASGFDAAEQPDQRLALAIAVEMIDELESLDVSVS